ncbi:DUF2807 domain-containing protein [Bacteroidales bacterium OttesenSCG-928-M06]|nr:DUF2807 domain-containing protein [Bacteroidales bacterium OttesenSCG-928-M06]
MKRFTPLFTLCFIIFPFYISCTQQQKEIKGNYEIIQKKIPITDYDEIVLALPAEVIYEQVSYEAPFLQVSVDKNILSSLDISVKNNRLIIAQNTDSILKPSQLKIFTNSTNIKKINIEQTGSLVMQKEVNARDMEISISGTGELNADSLYCENLKIELFEAGDITIQGAATYADFTLSGASDLKAQEYLVQHLNCSVDGSGEIEVWVSESLKALAKGSGELKYKGNPESVFTKKEGTGNIMQIEE